MGVLTAAFGGRRVAPEGTGRMIGLGSQARRLCMGAAAVGDTDALTVRIDLDGGDAADTNGSDAAGTAGTGSSI